MASSEDSRKAELTFRGMYLFHYSLHPNVMFMCCSTLSGEHVYFKNVFVHPTIIFYVLPSSA